MRLFDKILIVTVLLCAVLIAIDARAEVEPFNAELPMMCGDTENLLGGIREKYEEEIVMMATGTNYEGDELYHSLWINAGTQTWSFIVVNKPKGVTCVIASGDNFKMFFPGTKGI